MAARLSKKEPRKAQKGLSDMANFSVISEVRDGVKVYTLAEAGRARACVAPALGHNCFVFETERPVLEPVAWEDFIKKPTSYGIPVLFPFPNRIRNQEFTFREQTFRVNVPQHGFVRQRAWRVTGQGASDEAGAWLAAEFDAADYADELLAQFPFPFRAALTYRLREGVLSLEFTATNTGTGAMPCGFGIHPYFRWPARSRLQIPANKRWELAENLPTGKLLDVAGDYDLRELRDTTGLALDDIYTAITAANQRCVLTDDDADTATIVESGANLPHVVVYTAPPPRRALCIEPMSCPTDAFNLQARGVDSDVIVLESGESVGFSIWIATENL
jgi:aldose 1-epimerase